MAKKTRETLEVPTIGNDPMQSYMDAKYATQNSGAWDVVSDVAGGVLSGMASNREAKRLEEEDNKRKLELHEEQFTNNIAKINESAGGLGEQYMSIATEQAKILQDQYMEAVRAGDKETQSKLKIQLQNIATATGGLKESLTIATELKNEGALSNGRTAEEIQIASVCTDPNNAIWQDGTYVWKDPETGDIYTQDDLDKSLGQVDEVTSKAYLDYEHKQNENGMNFVNGAEGAHDFDFNRVKTSIADSFIKEDNIMSIMHDDFRKSGQSNTFVNHVGAFLDKMGDDMYQQLGIDVNGDGEINEGDWDTPEDKKTIIDVLTNKNAVFAAGHPRAGEKAFDFEVSKNIVADYLARQSQEKFYGEFRRDGEILTIEERRAIQPNDKESPESFKKRGGILGIWMNSPNAGVRWNEEYQFFERTQDLKILIDENDQ